MWHNRTSTFAEKSGTHFFLDAIILPDSNVFFFSIWVPHMAASGQGAVTFSALWSLQFSKMDT